LGSLIIILDFLHNSKSGQVRFYIDCSFSKIVYFNPIALSRFNINQFNLALIFSKSNFQKSKDLHFRKIYEKKLKISF